MQIKMKGRDGVDGKDGPCVSMINGTLSAFLAKFWSLC